MNELAAAGHITGVYTIFTKGSDKSTTVINDKYKGINNSLCKKNVANALKECVARINTSMVNSFQQIQL